MADVPMPDLSHLTEEERRQIEQVLQRQKHEEEKDKEVIKSLATEVKQIEQRVNQQKQQPFGGLIPDPDKEGLCDICQKVKFADGIGHQCNFCHLHSCARCGGRVPIKNGKFVWVCSLCKKKQELLKKTGQWYHGKPDELLSSPPRGEQGPDSPAGLTNGPSRGLNGRQQSLRNLPQLRRQMSHDPSQQQPQSLTQQQRQQSMRRRDTVEQDMPMSREDELRRQASMRRRGSVVENPPRDASRNRQGDPSRPNTVNYTQPSGAGNPQRQRHGTTGRSPQHQLPRRPDSQGGNRRAPDSDYAPRRRTQSYDRHNQEEYAADFDPRRGAAYDTYDERKPYPLTRDPPRPAHYPPSSSEERRRAYQQNSFSSSEDEMRSTLSDFTGDDGSIHSYRSEYSTRTHPGLRHVVRPTRGRLWRMSSQQEPEYYMEGYGGDHGPANVEWKPSTDGRRLIGHMILPKTTNGTMEFSRSTRNSATMLGLKIEGGKATASGRIGAFIVRVKPGSVADVIGGLRPGDEVLEWNAVSLRKRTYEEVYDVIADSRDDAEVELIVARKISQRDNYAVSGDTLPRRYSPRPYDPPEGIGRTRGRAAVGEFSIPGVVNQVQQPAVPYVSGRIQLSFYYLHAEAQLAVTVIQAAELLPRADQSYRNAYAKLYLLPIRSEQTKRRTKIRSKTNDPQWQETFYYAPLKESELEDLSLEIGIWDYERYRQNSNEFIGETLIELAAVALNDEPRWFYLTYPDTGLIENRRVPPAGYTDPDFTSGEGLSPAASSVSRLSDVEYASDPDLLNAVDHRKMRGSSSRDRLREQERGYYGEGGRRGLPSGTSRARYNNPSGLMESTRFSDQGRESPRRYRDPVEDPGSDRRGRSGMDANEEDPRLLRAQRRSAHHSAPPAGQDDYYYDENEGSPPGSHPSSMTSNSTRKRQLPILPTSMGPSHSPIPSSSRRPSLTLQPDSSPYDPQRPVSPSTSRHSSSRDKPIMQLHNATLKVPGDYGVEPSQKTPSTQNIHSTHPPKLDHLLQKSSQEENIDPREHQGINESISLAVPGAAEQVDPFSASRHSRSSSRRSFRNSSISLSRSSEPTQGENAASHVITENKGRKLSESLPRLQSMDIDDTGSQVHSPLLKTTSNTDVFSKKFDYELFESKMLAQQEEKNRKGFNKAAAILGLKKDSKRPTFTRSEEVGHQSPATVRAAMAKQMSKDSNDGSVSSGGHSNRPHLAEASHLFNFVDGLGPGQLVGRQVLASPCLGEIQLNIKYSKGRLEVEVIRAKALVPKPGTRVLPATFVKVQLMEDKRPIVKQKTPTVRRSLDPLYQQTLVFNEYIDHRSLQITVWADYGRMDKKVLLGVALIALDDLDLSSIVIGWYKLFSPESVTNPAARSAFPSGMNNNPVPLSIEERHTQRSKS